MHLRNEQDLRTRNLAFTEELARLRHQLQVAQERHDSLMASLKQSQDEHQKAVNKYMDAQR